MSTNGARPILALLAERHALDVFVSECKDGSTVYGSHRRMDAWAMKKSWAHPTTFGYEIKVTRSDFLRDAKWQDYLGLCSDFYFVTDQGVCSRDEIPEQAGWMELSKTGTRLFQRKRAPSRLDVVVPESLFRYILMSRAKITRCELADRDRCEDGHLAYWNRWLEERREGFEIGQRVSFKIREILMNAEREVDRAKKLYERDAELRGCLLAHGIDPSNSSSWMIERQISDLSDVMSPKIAKALDAAERAIAELKALASGETQERSARPACQIAKHGG